MTDGAGNAATGSAARIGIWVDDRPQLVLTDAYVAELQRLHVTVAAIMVDGNVLPDPHDPQWRPSWTESQLVEAARRLGAAGIDTVLTCWPVPDRAYIHTVCGEMGALIAASGAAGFEVDTEGLWVKANVTPPFGSLTEAGAYLAAAMRQAAPHANLQLTTYPYHAELSTESTVAKYMDKVLPRAYSTDPGADGKPMAWDGPLGPGAMQELAVRRARGTGVTVACGLAAYDQRFPGHTADDAMRTAFDRALALGCTEVRYWSSKWILGSQHTRTPEAARFLQNP